jgi:sulfane dehydrogenase subunit SoxC
MSLKSSSSTASPAGSRPGPAPDRGRRAFLKSGAALSALAGGMLVPSMSPAQSQLTVPEWMKHQGSPILSPPYGMPSPFEKNVVRRYREVRATDTAATTFAPLQDMYGIITPNGHCFERHHGGVP